MLGARLATAHGPCLLSRAALQRAPLRIEAMKDKNGKTVKKENLPSKVCATCNRPFTWRKKWEKVWDEVRYCSDRCRNSRAKGTEEDAEAERQTK